MRLIPDYFRNSCYVMCSCSYPENVCLVLYGQNVRAGFLCLSCPALNLVFIMYAY